MGQGAWGGRVRRGMLGAVHLEKLFAFARPMIQMVVDARIVINVRLAVA